ncbi:hypothetical protein ACOSQ4_030862 [Xanthoceras sorbifolium]
MLDIDTYKMIEIKHLYVVTYVALHSYSIQTLFGSKPLGFSLKLISLESLIYHGNLSQIERIAILVGLTQAKSNYTQFLLSTTQNGTLDSDMFFVPLHQDLNRDYLLYIVEVGIGTSPLKVNLLMDAVVA